VVLKAVAVFSMRRGLTGLAGFPGFQRWPDNAGQCGQIPDNAGGGVRDLPSIVRDKMRLSGVGSGWGRRGTDADAVLPFLLPGGGGRRILRVLGNSMLTRMRCSGNGAGWLSPARGEYRFEFWSKSPVHERTLYPIMSICQKEFGNLNNDEHSHWICFVRTSSLTSDERFRT
jgi:hypothetical protein